MSQTPAGQPAPTPQTPPPTPASPANPSSPPPTQPAPSSPTATDPFAGITNPEILAHLKSAGYKTVEDALTADMHAQRMIGLDKNQFLKMPKDGNFDADPAAKAAVLKAMGVPEKPDGYGKYQPATGNLGLSEQEMAGFDKAMHEAGATPASRNAALKFYHEANAAAEKAIDDAYTAQVNDGLGKLKGEWGAEYDRRLQAGEAAAKTVLGEEFAGLLKEMRVDDHPTVKRAFYNLAKAVAEDGRVTLNVPAANRLTPDQAQRKINEIIADPQKSKALNDPAHPDHNAAVAEWRRLNDDLAAA